MALRAATTAILLCGAALFGLVACGPAEQRRSEPPPPPDQETPRDASRQTNDESTPEEARRAVPTEREASPESGTDLAALLAEEGDGGGAGAYKTVAAGALTVEIPVGWEYDTGEESEGEGANWSEFGGEALPSSITAAPDFDAWYASGEVPGVYAVASRNLAQGYADDELVASGPNDASALCEPGARSDFERGPYSGRVQAWEDCFGEAEAGFVSLAAAPEGRECVMVLHAWMFDEDDVEDALRILDGFEVDCASASSYPLASAEPGQYASEQQYEESPESAPAPSAEEEQDCSDFEYQGAAQAVLAGDPSDPHGLDEDSDGVACEELLGEPGSPMLNEDTGLPLDQYGCVPQQEYIPEAGGCAAIEGYTNEEAYLNALVIDPETGEILGRRSDFVGE